MNKIGTEIVPSACLSNMACQLVLDYFIPRYLVIVFIVRLYLHFCIVSPNPFIVI